MSEKFCFINRKEIFHPVPMDTRACTIKHYKSVIYGRMTNFIVS